MIIQVALGWMFTFTLSGKKFFQELDNSQEAPLTNLLLFPLNLNICYSPEYNLHFILRCNTLDTTVIDAHWVFLDIL